MRVVTFFVLTAFLKIWVLTTTKTAKKKMIIELYSGMGLIRKFYTNAKSPRNAAKKYASYYPNTAYIIIRDYECSYRYDFQTANEPKKLWRKV